MRTLLFPILFIMLMSCCDTQHEKCVVPQQFTIASDPGLYGFDTGRLHRVDSLLTGYVSQGIAPNVVSFVARNGVIIHYKAYGYRDIEEKMPVKTTDIFRWASQTKAIATVALMTLYEEGKFMLDDPIEKYLPLFANPQVYVSGSAEKGDLVTCPAARSITVRQLITHTSGYSYNTFGENLNAFSYPYPVTTQEVIERIARTPLMHDPGEKFTYGFGIDIAGYLAEVLSGKKLETLIKERIFDPLGMNDSYFYVPKEKQGRIVKLYRETDNKGFTFVADAPEQIYPFETDRLYHGGGGGLCGTIEDYAKFCQMILNKGVFNNHRVLGRKTVEMMSVNHLIDVKENYPFGWGLGFEIASLNNNYIKTMVSEGALRWGGAFGTQYIIDTEENMILLVYTNIQNWSQHAPAPDRFMVSVYQALNDD